MAVNSRYWRRRGREYERGWATIAELLVGLVIIGLLMAFLLPRYLGKDAGVSKSPVQRARDIECMNNLRSLRQSIDMYRIDHEGPPPNLESLASTYTSAGTLFRCPVGGENYIYDANSGSVRCPHPGHERY